MAGLLTKGLSGGYMIFDGLDIPLVVPSGTLVVTSGSDGTIIFAIERGNESGSSTFTITPGNSS